MTANRLEIEECFSLAKSGNEADNEDGYLVGDRFVAVVDGATSKDGRTFGGRTGGAMAKGVILEVLSRLDGGETCGEAVSAIQRALVDRLPSSDFGHLCAAAAIFSVGRREIWGVGDCQIMVNGTKLATGKHVDGILAAARALAVRELVLGGVDEARLREDDLARGMILPFLKLQHVLENRPGDYGYCTFNNTTEDCGTVAGMAIRVEVPSEAEVVLATDGYPELRPMLAQSEAALARILERDPLCCRDFLSTKGVAPNALSFDDRTYVRFHVRCGGGGDGAAGG